MRHVLTDLFAARAAARLAIFAGAAMALVAAGPAGAAGANDPHGIWLRPEGGVQFSFYDCGGLLCAKVIGAQSAEDQASIGTVILRGASKSGPNEWKGKLYNSEDGKTYDGFITVTSANELTLKGCLWGVLCSGETWTRVASAPAAATTTKPQAQAKPPAQAKPQTQAMVDALK
jgi:uncharacterized protein (DUF2147 family)